MIIHELNENDIYINIENKTLYFNAKIKGKIKDVNRKWVDCVVYENFEIDIYSRPLQEFLEKFEPL